MKVDRVINQAIWEHQANTKGFPNNEYLNDLEKIRKTLEIIKEKIDVLEIIRQGDTQFGLDVSKEEYDLLKEVLL